MLLPPMLGMGGCQKPAQNPGTPHGPSVGTGSPAPEKPAVPAEGSKPDQPKTAEAPLTVPESLQTEAYAYYGLGATDTQNIQIVESLPDAKGKVQETKTVGTHRVSVRSVSEDKAEVVEYQTGGSEGDVTQTVSVTPDGLFLEEVDPGKLKTPHLLILPAHVKPGDTWANHQKLDEAGQTIDVQVTYKAVRTETLKTKFGDKTALYVTDEGTGLYGKLPYHQREEWWLVKGIGLAKSVASLSVGPRKFKQGIEIVP